ncbi:MAG: SH3 domain-containing protein [Eubacteriales bacterium]
MDIQSNILKKYKIDLKEDNIFKLYKIDNPRLSEIELDKKIQDTRSRWNTSINGANEKNAERDGKRLERADQYEAILRDGKMRIKAYEYYSSSSGKGSGSGTSSDESSIEFARVYFRLIATTKKVKREDVDFFFQYYQSQRKHKKAIVEMLTKEFKVYMLKKDKEYDDNVGTLRLESESEVKEEKKPSSTSKGMIVNLFQETTLLRIRRAVEKYEEILQIQEICDRYPQLLEGFYNYLEIKEVTTAQEFLEKMTLKGKEIYAVRQERGAIYIPLVDLYNLLKGAGECQDVQDNILEFKLLLQYPSLTSYMYSFVEMKPATLKGIINIANEEYTFRNDTDFLLNYYIPIHDNFGIGDGSIHSILRKAEKQAKKNKILNAVDEKLGKRKDKRKKILGAEIIHGLIYWPVLMVYLVFEVAKIFFTHLKQLAILIFVLIVGIQNWLIGRTEWPNLLVLRKILFKEQWVSFLEEFSGMTVDATYLIVGGSIMMIVGLLAVYLIPGLFVFIFLREFSGDFNKRFDWIGLERTFQKILGDIKKKTYERYKESKSQFIKSKIPSMILNVLCVAIVIGMIHYVPIGVNYLSELTGYGQAITTEEFLEEEELEETLVEEELLTEEHVNMVISVSSANIRQGPSTDYAVVIVAMQGEVFVATGEEEMASNGTIWYEIYLDEDMVETAWASEKVLVVE